MTALNRGEKWLCSGCNAWNVSEINRCSFCSKPRPADVTETVDVREDKLRQTLHTEIEKMSYAKMAKLWRWAEDNVV